MRVLGVDPGAHGAFALYDTDLNAVTAADMPTMPVRVGKLVRYQISEAQIALIIRDWAPDNAWMERTHAMPKQGVTSSFSFGLSCGLVRGVLAMAGVPLVLVTPNQWKRYFRLGSDKNEARLIAARQFPESAAAFSRVKDDGRAEAALLALFGAVQQKVS